MQLLCPPDPSSSIPFSIGVGPSEVGPRLGGRAPDGARLDCAGEYLLTIPLSADLQVEVSLFLAFSFDEMTENSGVLATDDLVRMVVHGPSRRGASLVSASRLSEHPICLGAAGADDVSGYRGQRVTRSSHKIGGRPFLMHGDPDLDVQVERAYANGFRQLVQLAFPGGGEDATVSGDWPFADGLFHVFVKESKQGLEFLRLWEF